MGEQQLRLLQTLPKPQLEGLPLSISTSVFYKRTLIHLLYTELNSAQFVIK